MNKKIVLKKLSINRETIRTLTNDELLNADGASMSGQTSGYTINATASCGCGGSGNCLGGGCTVTY